MKFRLPSLIIIIVFCQALMAQDTFQKAYSKSNGGSSSIQAVTDGGYIISGSHRVNPGRTDLYLLRIADDGSVIWGNHYGETGRNIGTYASQTTDGGFIACGYSQLGSPGAYKILVLKTDEAGNLIWSKRFGGHQFSSYTAEQVKQTSDGGFIICGYAAPQIAGRRAAYLIKTDAGGDTIWTRAYASNRDSYGNCVEQTPDGGYILAGQALDSLDAEIKDVLLVKTNAYGDTLWTRTFGGTSKEIGYGVKQTADGGYVVAGQTASFGAGWDDVFITKTDQLGNPVWTKVYGGSGHDRGMDLGVTPDNDIIVAGYSNSFGNGFGNMYLLKTNPTGALLWAKSLGGDEFEIAIGLSPTTDGGCMAVGSTNSFGNYGIYMVRSDSDGFSGCHENDANTIVTSQDFGLSGLAIHNYSGCSIYDVNIETASFVRDSTLCYIVGGPEYVAPSRHSTLSPNPFSDVTTLRFDAPLCNATLTVCDAFGRVVKTIEHFSGTTAIINRDDLPSGIYFVLITQDNKTNAATKMVISGSFQ